MGVRIQTLGMAMAALVVGLMMPANQISGQSGAGDGFLFHEPKASFTLRLGVARPNAQDGVFSFASDLLTINRSDFIGLSAAASLDFMVTPRVTIEMGAGFSGRDVNSEYRDWVDTDDLPIEQTTRFRRVPVSLGAKYYLGSTGRSLGRYAWVPTKFAPYVAAGGGLMYYAFKQSGDFVDFQNNDVFRSSLRAFDWTPMGYGSAGFLYNVTARAGIVTEARYEFAKAPMGRDFVDFPRIDLSGWGISSGLSLRF